MTGPDVPPTVPPAGYPGGYAPTRSTSNAHLVAPVGVIVSGLLALIGALLPWVTVSISAGGISQSVEGSSFGGTSTDSWRTVVGVLGAVILICGAAYLFGTRVRALLGFAAAFSLASLGVAIYKIVDIYQQAQQLYRQMDSLVANLPPSALAGFPGSFSNMFHIEPATGLWLVALANLLGTVFAVLVLVRARQPKVLTAPPPTSAPPPGFADPTTSGWPTAEPSLLRPATPPEPTPPDRPGQS